MKRNIVFLLTIASFVSLMFTSCEDNIEGAILDVEDGVHAAFASTIQKVEMLPEDGNQIKVPVYRGGNANSEVAVNVEMIPQNTASEGVFELTNPDVQFEEGEHTAYAIIAYDDINELDAGAVFELDLVITDEEQLSVSEAGQILVQANRKLTFSHFANGTFYSEFFDSNWPVEVEKAEEADVFRILDCYVEGFPLTFAANQDNSILYSTQETGYEHPDYGMVSFTMPDSEGDYYMGEPFQEENSYYLLGRFIVSAGSFGHWYEYLVLE